MWAFTSWFLQPLFFLYQLCIQQGKIACMAFLRHHIDLHKLDENRKDDPNLTETPRTRRNRFFSTKNREDDEKEFKEEKKQLENVGEARKENSTVNHSTQDDTA